jgi:hypothetical protein
MLMIDVLALPPVQQLLVLTVVPNPKPDQIGPVLHGYGAVVNTDTHRPKPPSLLEP